MKCPLQNIRVIESLSQQQLLRSHTDKLHAKQQENQDTQQQSHKDNPFEVTPSFARYSQLQHESRQQGKTLQKLVKQESNNGQQNQNQLFKYLQDQEKYDEQRNDYSLELKELRNKLIQIEQISQKQILRLKTELQRKQARIVENLRNPSVVSIGVNTQQDHKDDQIIILKQMLKQQCILNKQLLKQSLSMKQNIYQGITITKN